jgi:hypothetical protein
MEGYFTQDAGEVPAKFVVVPEAAQVQHHAVQPAQIYFQIIFTPRRFHLQFLSFVVVNCLSLTSA